MASVEEFREKIIGLKPGNFMALNGASAGIIGGSNSGGDAIMQLQRSAIEFTRIYHDPGPNEDLQQARKDVTGKIMIAVTLNALSEQRADELLDMLAELMKGKK